MGMGTIFDIRLIPTARQIHCSVAIRLVNMNLLNLLFGFLLVSLGMAEASLDLSTLDLGNVKFFKYPQFTRTGDISHYRQQPFNIIDPWDNFNRIKAMMSYFAKVAFGGNGRDIPVHFHPDTATKSRFNYQEKFGYRGEKLIAALGSGFRKVDPVRHDKWTK